MKMITTTPKKDISSSGGRTSSRFFLCFRPLGMMKNSAVKDVSSDLDVKCCIGNEKEKDLKMGFEKKGLKSRGCSDREEEAVERVSQKKSAKRILSRIVKAVVFESNLKKKSRNRKVGQDPLRSDSSLSSRIAKITIAANGKSSRRASEEDLKIDGSLVSKSSSSSSFCSSTLTSSTLSSSSSTSSSSSSSSSIASTWPPSDSNRSIGSISGRQKSSFRSDSLELKKQTSLKSTETENSSEPRKQSIRTSKITGVCLLLMSLCVLIFWGKVVAILCTSTWFYFVSTSCRGNEDDEPVPVVTNSAAPELIRSREYKKKIIMDGFLERNHRGGGFNLHH